MQNATTLNLASIIEFHARQRPNRTAIVWNETRLSYKQLNDYANKIANGLRSLGIEYGDKVALSCPNLPYFPMAYFGILKTGAVVVPLNVLFKPREIAYHLKDSDAKAFICFEGTPDLPMGQWGKEAFDETETCRQFITLPVNPMSAENRINGSKSLAELLFTASDKFETVATAPHDTATILYTSGTTGQPKGAELTHSNVFLNAVTSYNLHLPVMNQNLEEQDAVLITLPLFHTTGQTVQMNANLYGGSRCVLLPRFEPRVVLETMQREKINFWTGVPTMYWALLKHIEETGFDPNPIAKNLRIGTSGGAPMPSTLR